MEDRILKKNKIPGCDELTRPEEIKELGKFLKKIKEVQSEHTELVKDNLEIPGKTTGKLPIISELPTGSENLDVSKSKVDKLGDSSINIPKSETELNIELSEYRESLKDNRTTELSDYREKLDDKRNISLSNHRENLIDDSKDISLSTHKENLIDKRDTSLSNHVETLVDDSKSISLSDHLETLVDDSKSISLSDHLEKLTDDSKDITLSTHLETLVDDSKSISLSNYLEKLTDDSKDITLSTHKETLVDDSKSISLSDHLETLVDDSKSISLSDHLEKLTDDSKNISLSDHLEKLTDDSKNISLSDHLEKLTDDSKNISLSDHLEKLTDDSKDITLSTHKETLVDDRELNLSNISEKLSVETNVVGLSDFKEKLENTDKKEIQLENESSKESLPGIIESVDLSDFKEPLIESSNANSDISELENSYETLLDSENSEVNELEGENTRIDLNDDRENSLEDTRIDLNDDRENSLEDTRIDLNDERENSLEDTRIDLNDERENSLEDTRIDLKDERENSLEDTRIDLNDERENSLGDTRIDLKDERENSLEDYIDTLEDNRENSLGDTRIDLKDERENSLEDYIDTLEDDRENSLGDTKINIEDERETSLENHLEELTGINKEIELIDEKNVVKSPEASNPDTYFDSTKDGNELYDAVLERPNSSTEWFDPKKGEELYDASIVLPDHQVSQSNSSINKNSSKYLSPKSISDILDDLGAQWTDSNYLIDKKGEIIDILNIFGTGKLISNLPNPTNADIYNQLLKLFGTYGNWGEKMQSLLSSYLSSTTVSPDRFNEFENKLNQELSLMVKSSKLRIPSHQVVQDNKHLNNREKNDKYLSSSDIDTKLKEEGITTVIVNGTKCYLDRTGSFINIGDIFSSSSFSSEIPGTKKRIEDLSEGKVDIPSYNLPSLSITGGTTFSNYLRWMAEKSIGTVNFNGNGEARELLLNETLALLILARDTTERVTKSNRDRLPGNDNSSIINGGSNIISDIVTGGIDKAISGGVDRIVGSIVGRSDKENPINRPNSNEKVTGWTPANNRNTTTTDGTLSGSSSSNKEKNNLFNSIVNSVKDISTSILGDFSKSDKSYSFSANYLSGRGIALTLSDLCSKNVFNIGSVDDLFDTIRKSPYITVPDKFTTTGNNGYVVTTLDSNSYWEIVLEPYTGPENGEKSYLPALHEINTRNIALHGVNTNYNKWIPFISFDLMKSKINTKNLDLHDGSISFPISMEFLNELRITIVDDQYKSWRTYFEDCANSAIYNSELHDADYYSNGSGSLTAIDKSSVVVSMYKNITFRCIIYVMTPQLSTIKKYDLLLVMRDFTEESSGDIDSGGADLTISFSIVGENPKQDLKATPLTDTKVEKKDPASNDFATIISTGINNVIGVLN